MLLLGSFPRDLQFDTSTELNENSDVYKWLLTNYPMLAFKTQHSEILIQQPDHNQFILSRINLQKDGLEVFSFHLELGKTINLSNNKKRLNALKF